MDNTELAWRKIEHLIGECNKTGVLLLFKLKSIKQQPLDAITPHDLAGCYMHVRKTKQKSCKDIPLKNELNASLFPPAIMEYSNKSLNDTFISERQQ